MSTHRSASNVAIAKALREFLVLDGDTDTGELLAEKAQRGADHISSALKEQDFGVWRRMESNEEGDDW